MKFEFLGFKNLHNFGRLANQDNEIPFNQSIGWLNRPTSWLDSAS
jgi:hypothetical protein